MTVYVDELRQWPTRIRCFRGGSAHLTADTLEELHAMAARIGLRRAWFQAGRVPHYDLTPARRQAALDDGAVFVAAKEQARARRRAREGAVINGHRYAFGDVSVSIDGVDVRAVSPIAVEPSDEP